MSGVPQFANSETSGAIVNIANLQNIGLDVKTDTGYPTLDANGVLTRVNTTTVWGLGNFTTFPFGDIWFYAQQILVYLIDIWSETANRYSPGTDVPQGVISGTNPDVLGGTLA